MFSLTRITVVLERKRYLNQTLQNIHWGIWTRLFQEPVILLVSGIKEKNQIRLSHLWTLNPLLH